MNVTIDYQRNDHRKTLEIQGHPGGYRLLVDGRAFCGNGPLMSRNKLMGHLEQYRRLGAELVVMGKAPRWLKGICQSRQGQLFNVGNPETKGRK